MILLLSSVFVDLMVVFVFDRCSMSVLLCYVFVLIGSGWLFYLLSLCIVLVVVILNFSVILVMGIGSILIDRLSISLSVLSVLVISCDML